MERMTAMMPTTLSPKNNLWIAHRTRNRRAVTYDSIALTNATKAYL